MSPDEFVKARFGPIFDRIEETRGEIPDELLACLRRGVIVEAMEARAKALRGYTAGACVFAWNDGDFTASHDQLRGSLAHGHSGAFALFTDGTDYIAKAIGAEAADA